MTSLTMASMPRRLHVQVLAIIGYGPKNQDASLNFSEDRELFEVQEVTGFDTSLSEYCSEGSFRHIAGVVRYGGIAIGFLVVPDFMASSGLPVKGKAEGPEPCYNLSVSVARQPSHFMH